jgi:uncharacterized protein (DUF111 family)
MTPEAVGAAAETLIAQGAADVFTTAIYMKKNRPAVMLTVLCRPGDEEKFTKLILLHTTTLGVRISTRRRAILSREATKVATDFGEIRVKTSEGWGVKRSKPEYDDVARAAREGGVSFAEVYDSVKKLVN